MDHSSHIILIALGMSLGLVIWFWDSLRKSSFSLKSFALCFALILTLFHASPLSSHIAMHHQAQNPTSYHPCCAPQNADITPSLSAPLPITNFSPAEPIFYVSSPFVASFSLNNRSPPLFS